MQSWGLHSQSKRNRGAMTKSSNGNIPATETALVKDGLVGSGRKEPARCRRCTYCDKSTLLMLTAGSEAAGEACSVDRLVYPGPGRGRRRRACFVSDCPVSESSTSRPFQSATIWERKKYEHRFVSDNNECEAGSPVGKEGVGRRLVFEGSTD
jgi:hypothetical protein